MAGVRMSDITITKWKLVLGMTFVFLAGFLLGRVSSMGWN